MPEPEFKTSFIPKKPITVRRTSITGGSFYSLFMMISVVLFVVSLAVFGGAYLWRNQLVKQVTAEADDLVRVRENLRSETVVFEDLVRFDKKLRVANSLLERHTTVRPFLDLLSESTLKSVRFRNLNYRVLDSGSAEVRMGGEAESFNSVALQSKSFADSRDLSNIVFSGLDVGRGATVVFDFSANLKEEFISYINFKTSI